MVSTNCLELKKAKFYPYEIILIKNKKEIVVPTAAIDHIEYSMPSIKNFILANSPWLFSIYMRPNLYGTKRYDLCIKYRDFIKIQSFLNVPFYVD